MVKDEGRPALIKRLCLTPYPSPAYVILENLSFYWLERGLKMRGGLRPLSTSLPLLLCDEEPLGVFKRGASPSFFISPSPNKIF
jgi:hypothetical protein